MTNIGYIRVSTVEQNTARQLADLDLDKIFEDRCSGKDTIRPKLAELLEWVRDGDTIHVHSIDRLARNLKDLQNLVEDITARNVTLHFHKENLVFQGDDSPMQKLMLHLMGAFAEFERSLIRERQREGIAAAKKAGKQIGAKRKLNSSALREVKERLKLGESKEAVARAFGISRQTFYNSLNL